MHENTAQPIREENLESESLLDKLVRDVAADARLDPEAYVRETIVPEGGE